MRREWIEMVEGNGGTTVSLSPSMRREWIEIKSAVTKAHTHDNVSLHAEGVD